MYNIRYVGSTMKFYEWDEPETVSAKREFRALMKLMAMGLNDWNGLPKRRRTFRTNFGAGLATQL